jgi:hypothetical protein
MICRPNSEIYGHLTTNAESEKRFVLIYFILLSNFKPGSAGYSLTL